MTPPVRGYQGRPKPSRMFQDLPKRERSIQPRSLSSYAVSGRAAEADRRNDRAARHVAAANDRRFNASPGHPAVGQDQERRQPRKPEARDSRGRGDQGTMFAATAVLFGALDVLSPGPACVPSPQSPFAPGPAPSIEYSIGRPGAQNSLEFGGFGAPFAIAAGVAGLLSLNRLSQSGYRNAPVAKTPSYLHQGGAAGVRGLPAAAPQSNHASDTGTSSSTPTIRMTRR